MCHWLSNGFKKARKGLKTIDLKNIIKSAVKENQDRQDGTVLQLP